MFEGTIGALIGVLGVVLGIWLTVRHERQIRDRALVEHARQNEEEARARRLAELTDAVASVVAAANEFAIELSEHPLSQGAVAVARFSQSVQVFATRASIDHPPVGIWLIAETQGCLSMFAAIPKVGPRRRSKQAELGTRLGSTAGALVNWLSGQWTDDWFEDALRDITPGTAQR